jgi:acyl-homoserine lactone acylase PvdQ
LARAEGGKAFGREAAGNDYQLRMLKVPQINQRLYEGMELEARQIVDAFAEGINRYLADHPAEKPEWFDRATGLDVVAIGKAFHVTQTVAVVN